MAGPMVNALYFHDEQAKETVFYLERIVELLEFGCVKLARNTFQRQQTAIQQVLSSNHFQELVERVSAADDWNIQKEKAFWERLHHAEAFCEYKAVHDCAYEIMLHYNEPSQSCPTHEIYNTLQRVLARSNRFYIEPHEIGVNTFIDSKIEFVAEKRRYQKNEKYAEKGGNPGFHLHDAMGRQYRCFVKQVYEAKDGDSFLLKITNIPGLALTTSNGPEPILYLEPRVQPGELIEVELSSLSYTGNSYTFRHYSYDGFLWFKRRGVNKERFNVQTLNPKDRVIAKVLYTSEEEKHRNGKLTRLGLIKAIPIRWAESANGEANRDTDAAKVLN